MKMTEDDMKFVYFIVSKYYRQYLYDDDMIQTAMMGACQAYSKIPEGHTASSTYVSKAILNAIASEYRRRTKDGVTVVSMDEPLNVEGKPITLHDTVDGVSPYSEPFILPDWLTEEEKQLVYMLDAGYKQKEIADYLGVTRNTVSRRKKSLQSKLIRKGYLVGKEHRYGRSQRGCKTLSDEGITSGKRKVSTVQQQS